MSLEEAIDKNISFMPIKYNQTNQQQLLSFLEKCLPESGRALDIKGHHSFYLDIENSFLGFWCMFDGESIIGAVAVRKMDSVSCELKSLYLLEQYHGKGYGRKLLQKAIDFAKEQGYQRMYLDTWSTSKKAIALYRKMGFTDTEQYLQNVVRSDVFMMLNLNSKDYLIRPIEPKDNSYIESVIRTCLIEFGGNREGTAWCDPDLGRFSEIYAKEGHAYWIVEDEQGNVVGGAGIGPLTKEICELQKMYLLPHVRGNGVAQQLMRLCLEFAGKYYKKCYLETFGNMLAANRFYQKNGFIKLDAPYLQTEHFFCDVWYIKEL